VLFQLRLNFIAGLLRFLQLMSQPGALFDSGQFSIGSLAPGLHHLVFAILGQFHQLPMVLLH
jgi:hypothetical protein